jgi:hypothetical protein
MYSKLPSILKQVNLDKIQRVDIALEGDWNNTVVTVWNTDEGLIGFDNVIKSHQSLKPSIELYLTDIWIGIHSFKTENNLHIFDEQYASDIIDFIEEKIKKNV